MNNKNYIVLETVAEGLEMLVKFIDIWLVPLLKLPENRAKFPSAFMMILRHQRPDGKL